MQFKDFSDINLQRAMTWHQGGIDEWSISDWAVAMVGEAGEAFNLIKKFNRLRDKLHSNNPDGFDMSKLADELADTFIYLDLLASRCGIDLENAVRQKFNAISDRENLPFKIEHEPAAPGREAARGLILAANSALEWIGPVAPIDERIAKVFKEELRAAIEKFKRVFPDARSGSL